MPPTPLATVPGLPPALVSARGELPRVLRRFRMALALFLPAVVLNAGDFETAVAHFESRRFAEAESAFSALAEHSERKADIAYYRGALALRRNDVTAAVPLLEQAVRLAPDSARAHQALGDAYGVSAQKAGLLSKLGWAKKCLASYETAVSLAPDVVAYRLCLLAYYAQAPGIAGGGRDKALATVREIQRLDPIQGGLSLINLHVSDKAWPEAFAVLEPLLAAYPDHGEFHYQFGRLASLSGLHRDQGIVFLRRFLAASPTPGETSRVQAHFRLGTLLEWEGDLAGAKEEYRQVIEADPNHRPARTALDRMK